MIQPPPPVNDDILQCLASLTAELSEVKRCRVQVPESKAQSPKTQSAPEEYQKEEKVTPDSHNLLAVAWSFEVYQSACQVVLSLEEVLRRAKELEASKINAVSSSESISRESHAIISELKLSNKALCDLKRRERNFEVLKKSEDLMSNMSLLFQSHTKFSQLLGAIDEALGDNELSRSKNAMIIIEPLKSYRRKLCLGVKARLRGIINSLEQNAADTLATRAQQRKSSLDTLSLFVKFRSQGITFTDFIQEIKKRATNETFGMSVSKEFYLGVYRQLLMMYSASRVGVLDLPLSTQLTSIAKIHWRDEHVNGLTQVVKQSLSLTRNLCAMELQTFESFFGDTTSPVCKKGQSIVIANIGQSLEMAICSSISHCRELDVLGSVTSFLELEIGGLELDDDAQEMFVFIESLRRIHFAAQERLVYLLEVSLNHHLQLKSNTEPILYPDVLYDAVTNPPHEKNDLLSFMSKTTYTWDSELRHVMQYLSVAHSGLSLKLFETLATRCVQKLLVTFSDRSFRVRISTTERPDRIPEDLLYEWRSLHSWLYLLRSSVIITSQLLHFEFRLIDSSSIFDFNPVKLRVWNLLSFNTGDGEIRLRDPISLLDFFVPDIRMVTRDIATDLKEGLDSAMTQSVAETCGRLCSPLIEIDKQIYEAVMGVIPPPVDDDLTDNTIAPTHPGQTISMANINKAIKQFLDNLENILHKVVKVVALYIEEDATTEFYTGRKGLFDYESFALKRGDELFDVVILGDTGEYTPVRNDEMKGRKDDKTLKCIPAFVGEISDVGVADSIGINGWYRTLHGIILDVASKFELCLRCELELRIDELISVGWISMQRLQDALVEAVGIQIYRGGTLTSNPISEYIQNDEVAPHN